MLNHLPTISPPRNRSLSLPCDPSANIHAETLVKKYSGMVVWRPQGGGAVEAAIIPTEEERWLLESRIDEIERALLPAKTDSSGVARVAAAVASMLGGGYSSLTNVDRKATIAGYTEALQDMPAWAVERGCENVRKGKVSGLDPDWPPTHARMHQISEKELAPVIAEKVQISSVLALELPPQPDDAERERMNAKAKAWLERTDPAAKTLAERNGEQGGSSVAVLNQLASRGHEEIRRQWVSAGIEPRGYSLSLLKSLERQDEGEAA